MSSANHRALGLPTSRGVRVAWLPGPLMFAFGGVITWVGGMGLFVPFVFIGGAIAAFLLWLAWKSRPFERAVSNRTRRLAQSNPDHLVFSARGDVTAGGEILRFRTNDEPLEIDGRWTVDASAEGLRIWCGVTEDALVVEWPWRAIRTINLARDGRPVVAGQRPHAALTLGVRDGGRESKIRLCVVRTGSTFGSPAPFEQWVGVRDGLRALRDSARADADRAASAGT
ncbi:hypothetical protein GCM10009749_04470 [Agromyces neolithicus]|uniref:Uncharacterized protein n=1 Tax=Agromyces neolithicus TaxID=269420 RepID=A0ABP4Y7P6_9MICO